MNKVTISKARIGGDVRLQSGHIIDGMQTDLSYTFCIDPTPEDNDPIATHFAKVIEMGFGRNIEEVLENLRIDTPELFICCANQFKTLDQIKALIQICVKDAGE